MKTTFVYSVAYIVFIINGLHFHVIKRSQDEPSTGPFKVYRIFPNITEQLQFLEDLQTTDSKLELNFWKEPSRLGVASDIMVPPHTQEQFEKLLETNEIYYTVAIDDVEKLIIERENILLNQVLHDSPRNQYSSPPTFNFYQYQDYDTMTNFMESLEKYYSQIAKVYTIGHSFEDRPIKMIKISFPINSESKKAIWIDAGMHAREWIAHATAMYFVNELVTNYDKNKQIRQYVQNLTWYITPVINPDGYQYSRYLMIQFRRDCGGKQEGGASINSCQENYRGTEAFSEPESKAVRDFVLAHTNQLQAFLTFHSYSEIWMYPWGYQRKTYPSDVSDLHSVAGKATKNIQTVYGTAYKIGSGADTMYVSAGGSDDWAKSVGIKYVYLIELPPDEHGRNGFILPQDQIIPTGKETFEGVKVVANTLLKQNGALVT